MSFFDTGADAPSNPPRRTCLRWGLGALAALALPWPASARTTAGWPQWQAFVTRHLSADGRVIDYLNADQRSTSESQCYGLFFALCANDRANFDKLLAWTQANLAMGYLDQRLPAWLWGKGKDGRWRVLDDNSASDADLWMAYVLLEAGRLWADPALDKLGHAMLQMIGQQEVATLPGLGPMLLPGANGFALPGHRWRLNPGYLPRQLLQRFARLQPQGPWQAMLASSLRLLRGSAPLGFAPDWTDWDGKAFVVDAQYGATGSYDAIRCYLWAGMLAPADNGRTALLQALNGPLALLKSGDALPEKIDTRNGASAGSTPIGYAGALLPYLQAQQQSSALAAQLRRVQAAFNAAGQTSLPYYERVLILFGQGWLENRFQFAGDGRLLPAWGNP